MSERMNYWRGEHIELRRPTPTDIDNIVADFENTDSEAEWLADLLHLPRSAQACREHWERIAKEPPRGDECNLVIVDFSGRLCGFINVFDASARSGGFSYGISMLPEYRGLGYAAEAVRLILDFYFNHLRYHRCGIHIYDYNPRSIRFHEKLGFVQCGHQHECDFFDGEYHDSLLYEMLADNFNK
jgi:RimJ/RimL family protein N-acetyltransferase